MDQFACGQDKQRALQPKSNDYRGRCEQEDSGPTAVERHPKMPFPDLFGFLQRGEVAFQSGAVLALRIELGLQLFD